MKKTVWFDLDNSPHVPLFKPVLKELDKRESNYIITSRKFAQTEELLKLWKIPHHLIGKHGGKNKIKKVINLIYPFISVKEIFKRSKNICWRLAMVPGPRL